MAIRGDTSGLEKSYLLDMLGGDVGCVLEIGCGDGRLTAKYASLAAEVVGIDLPGSLPANGLAAFPNPGAGGGGKRGRPALQAGALRHSHFLSLVLMN